MKTGRSDNMAIIQDALKQPETPSASDDEKPVEDAASNEQEAALAPTGEEKPLSRRDQLREAQEQRRLQKEEDAKRSEAERAIRSTFEDARGIIKNTGVHLSAIPTPKGLVLPLLVLIICFLLLIPVNGHTRLVWIWLVLTGNAEITGSTNGKTSDTSPDSTGTTTLASAPTAPSPVLSPPPVQLLGTYAEDL